MQSSIIIKKPGQSSIYCLFTVQGYAADTGFCVTMIDMSLASGMGSVTAKNVPIYSAPCTEAIAATKHCNGVDSWIVVREDSSANFRSYLLTASGISTVAIVSPFGPMGGVEAMRFSSQGNKLALATAYPANEFGIFDFDNSTGVVFNPLVLLNPNTYPYSVEFSPSGNKLYGSDLLNLYQWNLEAGSDSLVIASINTYTTISPFMASLQLAVDGKIYVARPNQPYLSAFSFPDSTGFAAAFADTAISTAPFNCSFGLPNFPSDGFGFLSMPVISYSAFSNASSCQQTIFNGFKIKNSAVMDATTTWDFGDPASGSANTSTSTTGLHSYKSPGKYMVTQVMTNACGASQSLVQTIEIAASEYSSAVTAIVPPVTCKGQVAIVSLSGANQYSVDGIILEGNTFTVVPELSTVYVVEASNKSLCNSSASFILNVENCQGIGSQQMGSGLNCYPNPAIDYVTVDMPGIEGKNAVITLTAMDGRQIINKNAGSVSENIDLNGVAAGVYVLCVKTVGEKIYSSKVLVSR